MEAPAPPQQPLAANDSHGEAGARGGGSEEEATVRQDNGVEGDGGGMAGSRWRVAAAGVGRFNFLKKIIINLGRPCN